MSLPLFAFKWPDSPDYRRTPAVMWCQIESCGPLTKGFACRDFNIKVRPHVAGCRLLPSALASSPHHPQQPEDLSEKKEDKVYWGFQKSLNEKFQKKTTICFKYFHPDQRSNLSPQCQLKIHMTCSCNPKKTLLKQFSAFCGLVT